MASWPLRRWARCWAGWTPPIRAFMALWEVVSQSSKGCVCVCARVWGAGSVGVWERLNMAPRETETIEGSWKSFKNPVPYLMSSPWSFVPVVSNTISNGGWLKNRHPRPLKSRSPVCWLGPGGRLVNRREAQFQHLSNGDNYSTHLMVFLQTWSRRLYVKALNAHSKYWVIIKLLS